jgi:hypothetical protein
LLKKKKSAYVKRLVTIATAAAVLATSAQLFGHGLHVTDIEFEFPGNLLVRPV